MKSIILKCKPNSRFHFGKIALNENMSLDETSEIIHSDTLFSAIINTVNRFNPNKVESLIGDFENGNIKISSAFYCLQIADKFIYFYPKPEATSLSKVTEFKKLKKIKFVSQKIWEEGIEPKKWLVDEPQNYVVLQNKFICKKEEFEVALKSKNDKDEFHKIQIFNKTSAPKVKVHTTSETDKMYNRTDIEIADNSEISKFYDGITIQPHFYFLYQTKTEFEHENLFITALEILAQTGIGGERSVGCGFIEEVVFANEHNFSDVVNSNFDCSLSLCIPKDGEFDKFQYYSLTTRGGRVIGKNEIGKNKVELKKDENLKLKRVRMIQEAAIITKNSNIAGKIENITPEKLKNSDLKYKRLGTTITIPVKIVHT